MYGRSKVKDVLVAILVSLLVLVAVVGFALLKVAMYGDPACLVVHCVKVIR